MIQDLYDSFYKAIKKEAEWLYKGNSDEFIDSQAVRNIAVKMLRDMEDIMRKEFYERHREWKRKKLLERIAAFKKKPIKSVDWLQYLFDTHGEGKYVAFFIGTVDFFTLMREEEKKGNRMYLVNDYLEIFMKYFSKRGYIKDKRYVCSICNLIDNSLMEILEEEGSYEISFAGKTLKFSRFKGSECEIGKDALRGGNNPCRCCLLDITETN